MGIKIRLFQKVCHIAEHRPAVHMMAIEQQIRVAQVCGAAAVQKDGSREGEFPQHAGIDVLHIICTLNYGIVNVGAVHRDPAADVRVQGLELLHGGGALPILGNRLIAHKSVSGKGGTVNIVVVPQAVGAVKQQNQHHHSGSQVQQPIAGADHTAQNGITSVQNPAPYCSRRRRRSRKAANSPARTSMAA